MNYLYAFSALLLLTSCGERSREEGRQDASEAVAILEPLEGYDARGIVIFTLQNDGLHINADVTGMTPGDHGIHIHEGLSCKDPGGHFNPTNRKHGAPESRERHLGDLGNIHVDEKGNGTYERIDTVASLNGPNSIVGHVVILHAKGDDYTTQPSGNSGEKVACGIIAASR